MRMMDMARRMAILSLALLPPVSAVVYIALFAKDGLEVASAMMGVAGVITFASLVQIALLLREMRKLSGQQEDTRKQALALARCMRDLNQRMAMVEGEAPSVPAATAAPRRPTAPMAAPPAPTPQPMPNERRIVTLPHRRLAGIEPLSENDTAAAFRRLTGGDDMQERFEAVSRTILRGLPHGAFVLLVSDGPLSAMPDLMGRLEDLSLEAPEFTDTFLLGISQASIRRGGTEEAAVLARLARAGIRFMLTDVADFALDPAALAACNITHVRIDARQITDREDDVARLGQRLESAGLQLIADHVDSARLVPELIDCGIRLASGSALETPAEAPSMPWRAGQPRTASLSARAEDSIRYRATG